MNRPKDWWGNPANAKKWIKQNARRTNEHGINTTTESTKIVVDEIMTRSKDFFNVLEVGAGDGRIIGALSQKPHKTLGLKKCYSCDINPELSAYILEKYRLVMPHLDPAEIINLPFDDNSFDLVYTYQVLQHVHPEEIEKAILELCRVAKKEVWMWEGIGRQECPHGSQTHKAHNGSWAYKIDRFVNCYEVSIPRNVNITLERQRLYKVKV